MPSQKAWRNGAIINQYSPKIKEHLYLYGQRISTPDGKGEVTEAIDGKVIAKLGNGKRKHSRYPNTRRFNARKAKTKLINFEIVTKK